MMIGTIGPFGLIYLRCVVRDWMLRYTVRYNVRDMENQIYC